MRTLIRRDSCTPKFTAASFTITKIRSNLSVHHQTNGYEVHTEWNTAQAEKKESLPFVAAWIQLEGTAKYLSKISLRQDKHCMVSLKCKI